MVNLKAIFERMGSKTISEDSRPKEQMSSVEREVLSFREMKRQDDLKKELAGFRKTFSILNDNQGSHSSILSNQDRKSQLLGGKAGGLLSSKNVFASNKNTILKSKGGLF